MYSIYTKRLRNLIIVFAAGSVLMGTGTRIILDCLVTVIVIIVMVTHWHVPRGNVSEAYIT